MKKLKTPISSTSITPILPTLNDAKTSIIYNSKATSTMHKMINKKQTENQLSIYNPHSIKYDEVELALSNIRDNYSINTDKLFLILTEEFTKNNNKKSKTRLYNGGCSLNEIMSFLGKDYTNKQARKDMVKQLKKDANILTSSKISFQGINGESFRYVNIFQEVGYNSQTKCIEFSFTERIGNYLIDRNVFTTICTSLYKIDGRNSNAYKVFSKMAELYSIPNNHLKNKADIISIKNLLKDIDLPTYEKVLGNENGWKDRILLPLEEILEDLVRNNNLKEYYFTKAKREPLDYPDIYNVKDYYEFTSLYVVFAFPNEEAQEMQERAKKHLENKKKSKDKRKKASPLKESQA